MTLNLIEVFKDLLTKGPQVAYSKLTYSDLYTIVFAVIAIYIINWLFRYLQIIYQVRGLYTVHSGIELFEHGARGMIPNIPFIAPTEKFHSNEPWKKYELAHSDLIASTQLSTPDHAVYITSSSAFASSIATSVKIFSRPSDTPRYNAVMTFGDSIAGVADGPAHKRHRNIVKSCFGEAVMANVWNSMIAAYRTMIAEEGIENGGVVNSVYENAIKITVIVIAKAGFGVQFPWDMKSDSGNGQMTFYESVKTIESNLTLQVLFPLWLMEYFPMASVRRAGRAKKAFFRHCHQFIIDRRAELTKVEQTGETAAYRDNILSALVHAQMTAEAGANQDQDKGVTSQQVQGLTREEVVGNLFIFIVAGHETAAHTLTWVQAYLALYPEWQEKVYQEIVQVSGGGLPSYRDVGRMQLTLAVCYEVLRLHDLIMTLPKEVTEDTVIPYTTWDDQGNVTRHVRKIPKGSRLVIDTPGAGLNPFQYPDPTKFDPMRFMDRSEAGSQGSSFMGFSQGTRGCIGKRFAEVEMVAYLSHMLCDYKISPVPEYEGEDWETMKKRMVTGRHILTMTPPVYKLNYERREHL